MFEFLQSLPLDPAAALAGAGIVMTIVYFIFLIAVWIYSALAFSKIAKRAGNDKGWIAWIPFIGPVILTNIISGKHWWPWLLWISLLIAWIPIIGWFIFMIAMIVFAVFSIIWMWKTYEAVGRPGWWAVLVIIPFIGNLLYLIFIGIAAWGGGQPVAKPTIKQVSKPAVKPMKPMKK